MLPVFALVTQRINKKIVITTLQCYGMATQQHVYIYIYIYSEREITVANNVYRLPNSISARLYIGQDFAERLPEEKTQRSSSCAPSWPATFCCPVAISDASQS